MKSMSTVGCAHAEVGLPTTWVKTTSQKTKPISYGQPMAIFFQGFTGQIVIFHQPCRLPFFPLRKVMLLCLMSLQQSDFLTSSSSPPNRNINAQRQSAAAKRDDHGAADIELYLPPKAANIQREVPPRLPLHLNL